MASHLRRLERSRFVASDPQSTEVPSQDRLSYTSLQVSERSLVDHFWPRELTRTGVGQDSRKGRHESTPLRLVKASLHGAVDTSLLEVRGMHLGRYLGTVETPPSLCVEGRHKQQNVATTTLQCALQGWLSTSCK